MSYDSAHHQTVLFVAAGASSETWVFDAGSRAWTKKTPATVPALRTGLSAFDAARRKVVLIGGTDPPDTCDPGVMGQTWTWDGADWTQQHPTTAPDECFPAGAGTAVFDAAHRDVFALDSDQLGGPEEWTWDGADWHAEAVLGPLPGAALAYDPHAQHVLSFGGFLFFHGTNVFGETEAWDGRRWTPLSAGDGSRDPQPRAFASMIYDPTVGAPVMFGGTSFQPPGSPEAVAHADTWRWTGRHWVRMGTSASPPPMGNPSFVYDSDHRVGVLFGAQQTWLFTAASAGGGAYLAGSGGGVFVHGTAHNFGSAANLSLRTPIVGIARTVTRQGYWLAARDGGVFAFGDARFYGGAGNIRLVQPIVGIAPTPSGRGYWLVASDGGIFAFGDALFAGSTGGIHLNQPIVGMAPTPTGDGYWLVARDGGVFAFGDARYFGSTGNIPLNQPITAMASTPRGSGYWLVARDGGVFAFGRANFHGVALSLSPTVSIATSPSGNGYWTFTGNGSIYAHGDAPADLGPYSPHTAIVAATPT